MSKPTPFDRYKPSPDPEDELVKDVTADIMSKLMRKADAETQEPDNSNVYQFPFGKRGEVAKAIYRNIVVNGDQNVKCPMLMLYDRNRVLLSKSLRG